MQWQTVLERMTDGGGERFLYDMDSSEASEIMLAVNQKFGQQNWSQFCSIGNSAINTAFNTKVVTAVYSRIPDYLWDIGARTAERKYHMDTEEVYEKMFVFKPEQYEMPLLPKSAQPLAVGMHHTIAGYKGNPEYEKILDVYFGADPDDCEMFYGLERNRGAFSTWYGVTYVAQTKDILRVKTYTYEAQNVFSNWTHAVQTALSFEKERDEV